jgi:hypothetical protein
MSASHELLAADYYGPAIGGLCFVLGMSRVPEPARRSFNAILVAGTYGTYHDGSLSVPYSRLRLCTPVSDRTGSSELDG